jgi:S-DNA-T family DNA segregation ATPase FtsK/SpoIIIE
MRIQLTIRDTSVVPRDREVIVDCPPRTPSAELRRALGATNLFMDDRQVSDASIIGSPPLLDGAVVRVDARADPRPVTSPWELWVLAGPDVGLRIALPTGRSIVGRSDDALVRLSDLSVSRHHAWIDVTPSSGPIVADLQGRNGTRAFGVRLGRSARPLAVGDVVDVGRTRLQLRRTARDVAPARPDGEGHLVVQPGGPSARVEPEEVRFPEAPTPPARTRFPLVALAVPLLMAAVLAAVMRSPTMLLFGLTGPVLSVASWLAERRRRRSHPIATAEHAAALDDAQRVLARAVSQERTELERSHPPMAGVLATVETRTRGLWRKDGWTVSVGIGTPRSTVRLVGDTAPSPPRHDAVPVTLDLAEVGVLGVHGAREQVRRSTAALVCRLAVGVPPSRLEVHVVAARSVAADWEFVRRIPHTRDVAVAGAAGSLVDRVVAEIGRREEADRVRAPPERPLLVVLVDGSAGAEGLGLGPVLRRGPSVGVAVVVLAESPTQLPATCAAVLSLTAGREGLPTARLSSHGASVELVPDLPGPEWVRRVTRALAPLRDALPPPSSAELPVSVRLLDLVGQVDAAGVEMRWSTVGSTTTAVLGVAADGPVMVDLAVDGPHALVAGTTGAGKSELLQTLVCSLALANRPDELTFLLVDYKGGAAFRGCADLPHVVGVVTDLDGHLTSRALTSLTAELRRRERLFAAEGASSLEAYERLRANQPALSAVPRLVIVIDEFRVLAEELPDFVNGLVRLAAVGRSLGVHLVLATQRPGGIVSADIRANVSLRIALRVRDRTDSVDVLDAPDAASIDASTPGRASLRGATTPLTRFQSARVTAGPGEAARLTVTPVPSAAEGWVLPPRATTAGQATGGGSDLDHIVCATREAARSLGIPDPRSPWLAPLPDVLDVSSLGRGEEDGVGHVRLGMEDDPAAQTQTPWSWVLTDGHLGIAGGGRSGRTAAVLLVAAQLVRSRSPSELHLYAIGPPELAPLEAIPHVAVVADVDDADHVRLVVERLAHLTSASPESGARPVLLVDGWERLAAHAHGSLAADVRTTLEGAHRSGLRAVVTGGRAVLAGQLVPMFAQRLVLALADPVDLAVAGIPPRVVPTHQPPGRALDARTHRQIQIARLTGVNPAQELADVGRRWTRWPSEAKATPAGERTRGAGWPRPVRRLPTSVRVAPGELDGVRGLLPVGVRDGDLERVGFDIAGGDRRILVVGPPRSGRSTTLHTLAAALGAVGHPVTRVSGYGDADRDRLVAHRRAHPDLAVLVDDAERLAGTPLEPVLLEIARRVDEDQGVVVAATSTLALESRAGALATGLARAHTGVVLWPAPGSAGLGVGPAISGSPSRVPGRGVLVTPSGACRIQIATVD